MALASKFRNPVAIRSTDEPLSEVEMRAVAPSIFADEAHETRSERYTHIPTIEVLRGLEKEGFRPFAVAQTRVRDEGRREFTKHMIRLRHANTIAADEANEVVLLNSHDGSSSYQMLAGMFRFVCANGMVCGETIEDIRIRHSGRAVEDVIEGAYQVLGQFELVENQRDGMKAVPLDEAEQQVFADAALALRYDPEDGKPAPIAARQLLRPRRIEDAPVDLWSTFNRVQENVIRGGLPSSTRTGRRTKTREVKGIDQNVKLNRALWILAEGMRNLKTNG
ncbi:DUF932 domain-containing protein [Nocardia africana]|uniref:Domain of uncharacterized function (DUF932) n=1 Tax=Nocardia africana TaxID=134964 RepID=A0A379X4T5_9NOCA|nr:DUF932 domain-containing protein [Nocardia africana]MCC3318471.1 DUF945 domain-containing protein [Nocardia africana]SUH71981.1 Domain of uncharacterised function (DUF932) [Nocardia africana]